MEFVVTNFPPYIYIYNDKISFSAFSFYRKENLVTRPNLKL